MDLKYQLLKIATDHKEQVRGRYAPSPSGVQHLGNIRTAVVAWLQARLAGGTFVLRMDDIDTPRVKVGSAAQIIDDLQWLGMDWDEIKGIGYAPGPNNIYTQTDYRFVYQARFEALRTLGKLYPCTCSRRDIRRAVRQANSAGHYVYPGTCRERASSDIDAAQRHVWRYRVADELIHFSDQLMGDQVQNVEKQWGDLIVKRNNGLFAYQWVSVIDDIEMGISDVVRGEDLLDSTASQIALFHALGAKPPRFWHVPLKLNKEGEKLAKRDGSESLQLMREAGSNAAEVIGSLSAELGLISENVPIELEELRVELLRS